MPWTTTDVKTKAAKTDAQKRQWVAVANEALASCLKDGGSQEECEASAIKQANGVLKEDDVSEMTVTATATFPVSDSNSTIPTVAETARIIPVLPPGTLMPDPPEESSEAEVPKTEEIAEAGKRLNATQLKNLAAAMDTIKGILTWANYEDGEAVEEEVVSEFTESASGHVMGFTEAKPVLPDSVVPLHLDAVLIEPGWGNARDGHYYPREILERDSKVFAGIKMYETDHRPGEKSTRTWVSTVKEIKGFTDDGAPIGSISVHDRNFAERLLALDADGLLHKMECSILAGGTAKNGKRDGRKAKIVESITEAESVDWVTRAGAGGRALALAESEGGTMDPTEETPTEEQEPIEEVAISEDAPEAPAPVLSKEKVTEKLDETNLPKASKARLSEVDYADDVELEDAVKAEIAYVKELTKSGQPFGMNSEPLTQTPLTEDEKTARFNERMREVGAREV